VARPARARHRWHADRGASPIELAILLPVIIAALFAGVQVALYFLARSEALAAAQAGATARAGYLAPDDAADGAAGRYVDTSPNWLEPDRPAAVSVTASTVTVTVSGTATSVIPGWHIAVQETARGQRERLIPSGAS